MDNKCLRCEADVRNQFAKSAIPITTFSSAVWPRGAGSCWRSSGEVSRRTRAEEFDDAGESLPVTEVARRTGLHRATVHRTLTVLLQLGYVHKDQDDLLYTTGFYLHTFGHFDNIIASPRPAA
jgi:DNA-binding transcriptional ArsR family regulator